ncbi:MAG: pyruvate ferredoxin oxidoreductase subunit gamma [Nanoarchaeota archaeon]|nr:pyruvate ferredoxin oxidoreductase subunit gamma [Nanoarchaeota archaeon]
MIEMRIIGRGGQGAVTSAQILAIAAFYDGKQSQAFPNFGVERRGAPSYAYVRIDDRKINNRSLVYEPDYLIVLDASLLNLPGAVEGVSRGTKVFVNSSKPESCDKTMCVTTFDATKTAMEVLGKPIVNTAVLGGFAAKTGIVSIKSLVKAVDDVFDGELAEKNKKVMEKVYEEVKSGK